MSTLTRRGYGPFGDVIDWLETPWTVLRQAGHPMPVEDYVKDGYYVLRAELPGVDPEKDVEVSVAGDTLTIKAERREEKGGKHHSEFRYGMFSRTISLPAGTSEDHFDAVYGHGILEVTVRLEEKEAGKPNRKIPVRQNQHIKPS
jgi:HSP20 family protein